tara:strand:- start:362 stop:493 length:132 start_codon:yes stop_codon:yes gene_type:complete
MVKKKIINIKENSSNLLKSADTRELKFLPFYGLQYEYRCEKHL